MKKIIIMLLAGALAVSALTACTDGNTDATSKDATTASKETSEETSEAPKYVDMDAILAEIKNNFVSEEKREISEDDIYTDTGIDPASYEGYFWLTEISGLSSEKALMFRAKDEASANAIKAKLDTVLSSELAQMKDYNADNYAMLQNAVCEQKGLYVYLLVSPNVDKFVAAVNSAF